VFDIRLRRYIYPLRRSRNAVYGERIRHGKRENGCPSILLEIAAVFQTFCPHQVRRSGHIRLPRLYCMIIQLTPAPIMGRGMKLTGPGQVTKYRRRLN
jgi:hypothetical protein